VGRIAGKLA